MKPISQSLQALQDMEWNLDEEANCWPQKAKHPSVAQIFYIAVYFLDFFKDFYKKIPFKQTMVKHMVLAQNKGSS